MGFMISSGQTVFARWRNGYYYPATVEEVLGNEIKVSFLDGYKGKVARAHVVELQEAFQTMQFQSNWKHGGIFFKGKLTSQLPMIMHYDDGDVEEITLDQLRGRPPRPPAGDVTAELEQLKSLYKAGLLTKEEYKHRRSLLR